MKKMKYKNSLIINIVYLFLIGCQSNITKPTDSITDTELIYAIKSSPKVSVSIGDLPTESRNVINNIIEYENIDNKLAIGLGYEVSMAGMGHRSGHRSEVYFSLDGKKLNFKEELDEDGWGDFGRDKYDDSDYKCFDLVFPVSFIMPDGIELTVTDDTDSGWAMIKVWYDENSDIEQTPTIKFPIQIFLEDGDLLTLNNIDEMNDLYRNCRRGKSDWGRDEDLDQRCFSILYPVTYLMPDGTELNVTEDTESGWSEVKAWYEANPDSDQKPYLQYPVDIIFETEAGNESLTINNEEEMWIAKERCRGYGEGEDWDEEEPCFEFDYPITYLMPDGTELNVIEDTESGWSEVKAWYEANPDSDQKPYLQYPVDIIFETEAGNESLTINNEEEMWIAKERCRGYGEGEDWDEEEPCFEFDYPITYLMPDGTEFSIAFGEDTDGWMAVRDWYINNPGIEEEPALLYPVDLVLETGDIVTINTNNEMSEFEEEFCREVNNEG